MTGDPPALTAGVSVEDPVLSHCLQVADRTRRLCHEIVTALESSADGDPSEQALIDRSRRQKQLNALLVQLKGLHRCAVMASREAKDSTSEARREVDRLHLQLQNLYYEQRHLRGEINACEEFP